jgi:predicted nucleic acid-binding protein
VPNQFILDASALGKRYLMELGTPALNQFFSRVDPSRIAVLNVGILEVISIMTRSRNRGQITNNYFENALVAFANEIIESDAIVRFGARDSFVMSAAALIPKYSVNATDAIILHAMIELAKQLRQSGHAAVLISSDQRLITATQAEGIATFNPETNSTLELDELIDN